MWTGNLQIVKVIEAITSRPSNIQYPYAKGWLRWLKTEYAS